jgi:hypothetical protein
MRQVLASDHGSELYRKRQPMIEPVFAQMKYNRGLDRFQRRGRGAVRTEWRLITATHSLRDETARLGLRRCHPDAKLASGESGQGLLEERRLGRPCLSRAASPTTSLWPPLRLARLCREHESVLVVCPPVPRRDGFERREESVRSIGLRRPLDFCEVAICQGGGCGPAAASRPARRGSRFWPKPLPRRSGGVGGDRQRAGDRAAAGAARGTRRRGDSGRSCARSPRQGQDRPDRPPVRA